MNKAKLMSIVMIVTIFMSNYSFALEQRVVWTKVNEEVFYNLSFYNNKYIVTGYLDDEDEKTNFVKVSDDFENWTTYALGRDKKAREIYYAKPYWYSSLGDGYIYKTTDFENWEKSSNYNIGNDKCLYLGNKFFRQGSGNIQVSSDTINWVDAQLPWQTLGISSIYGADIYYMNNQYMIMLSSSSNKFTLVSNDGINWTGKAHSFKDVEFMVYDENTGKYLAVVGKKLIASENGLDWQIIYEFESYVQDMKYINDQVVVRYYTDFTTPNDDTYLSWTKHENRYRNTSMEDYLWDGAYYRAFAGDDGLYSANEHFRWDISMVSRDNDMNDIIFDNGTYIAACDNNMLAFSEDAVRWGYRKLDIVVDNETNVFNVRRVAKYGNDMMIAVHYVKGLSNKYAIYRSSDKGVTWTKMKDPIDNDCDNALLMDDTYYIAVGYKNYRSGNGDTWIEFDPTSRGNVYDIAYGNGKYILCTDTNMVAASSDGIHWTEKNQDQPRLYINRVAFDNGKYLGFDDGNVYTSDNGLDWKQDYSYFPNVYDQNLHVDYIIPGNNMYLASEDYKRNYYIRLLNGEKVKQINDDYIITNLYEYNDITRLDFDDDRTVELADLLKLKEFYAK